MAHLSNIEAFYATLTFHFKYQFLYRVNSPASADGNQLNCEKVRFLSEMNEVNSRLVIFNL